MSTTQISAHRSYGLASAEVHSAHRSPSPWPRSLAVTDTMSVPMIELAPIFGDLDAKWWEFQKRFTLTMRAHREDGVRVMRFYTRRARARAMNRYLRAHRRVYGWMFPATGVAGIGFESLS